MIAPLLLGIGLWAGGIWLIAKARKYKPALTSANVAGAIMPGVKSANPPANELDIPPVNTWVKLVIDGTEYLVSPVYVAPIGIGEAVEMAKENGWVLPTPRMVDAIWREADVKLNPQPMAHDGTLATMNSQALTAAHRAKIDEQLAGREFRLLAGSHKDVAFIDEAFGKKVGKPGIYGWHRPDGSKIQDAMWGHALAWKDYSQGLRPIKKVEG